MLHIRLVTTAVVLLLMLLPAACQPVRAPAAAVASEAAELPLADFDASKFGNSAQIDNEWMPMPPGTRLIYEGTTIDDSGEAVPHRVEITYTDLTKVIGGVRTLVSWDLDYSNDELVEAELGFYAQDNEGTVWHLGQYPEEYDGGEFVAAPSWIHGIEDARAGIHMLAAPKVGAPSYSQGWGPAVNWTDRGKVDAVGTHICIPLDCYEDVLVIAETAQSEPGAEQLKYFARGVGNIGVGWRGEGEKTKETLDLVRVQHLTPEELADARAQALALEKNGYERSPNVYALTSPVE